MSDDNNKTTVSTCLINYIAQKLQQDNVLYNGHTLHEVIKCLIFSFFLEKEGYSCLPEFSRYTKNGNKLSKAGKIIPITSKRRLDILVLKDKAPFLAIEIDRSYKTNNYETLKLFPECLKLWIGYSQGNTINCSDSEITIFNVFDHISPSGIGKKKWRKPS